ncbi:MAG: GNA1162 family protein [Thermodesulfobacteriota bacterium]
MAKLTPFLPSPWCLLLLPVLACSLIACAIPLENFRSPGTVRATGTETTRGIELPNIIAIMPFQNQSEVQGADELVRKNFSNLFGSKSFIDIELAVIDEKIVQLERETGRAVSDLKPQEVCQAIGCDGLLFGKVTDFKRTYAGIFSQLGAAAEIWMVDAKTGTEVVRIKDAVNYYEGGIPFSQLGAIMTALTTAANVRELQEMRMVNELSHKLVKNIPEPAGAPAVRRPEIREVITNVIEGPFGRGGVVRVGLEGEPGIVAAFDIGNFKKGLPMKETQPGVYLGEYAALPGDNTRDMPVIASLKRPSGPESQWIDTSGLVTIDTTAPPQVAEPVARSFFDRIELSWAYPPGVPDLAGYLVLRSLHPLSGFEELARVELNAYEDRKLAPDTVYYYRIVAVDNADNRSEFSSTVKSRLTAQGPTVLTGEVRSDTILSGIYTLKGQLTVPQGVTLTLGPETTIMAETGAGINVQGKLLVDGLNGQVRLFGRQDGKWTGIAVAGGHVEMKHFVLSGSTAGLTLKDTDGLVENAVVTDNDAGIAVSGAMPVVVWNSWVAGNRTGIELIGSGAKVLQSVIVRNGTGLSLQSFSGEVRENVIIDNERNILSDSPLKLDPNYLGLLPDRGMGRFAGLGQGR